MRRFIRRSAAGFRMRQPTRLWELVWAGLVTNDTYHPVRSLLFSPDKERTRGSDFLYCRLARPGLRNASEPARRSWSARAAGRRVRQRVHAPASPAEWSAATAQQLLVRHGIVMRETAVAENVPGGYAAIYPALKTMEESGWIRRGMFVAGMGAAQFATPKAVDMLRSLRMEPERPETVHLAASDPANPYGSLLPWLEGSTEHTMARAAGANVILVNGRLAAFFRRRNPALHGVSSRRRA